MIAEFAATLQRASTTTMTSVAVVVTSELTKPRMQRTMASVVRVTARAIRSTSLAARLSGLLIAQRIVVALANIDRHTRESAAAAATAKRDHDEQPMMNENDESTETYASEAPMQCQLLPTVHDLWASVLARLDDRRAPVVIDAVRTVEAFINASGSFVATRFAREAWPLLTNHMRSTTTTTTMLGHSGEHKRSVAIVECVAAAVRRCELTAEALVAIRDACAQHWSMLRWPESHSLDAVRAIERDCIAQLNTSPIEPTTDVL